MDPKSNSGAKMHQRSDKKLEKQLAAQLGAGPMRFGPVRQGRAFEVEAQLRGLTEAQLQKYEQIKRSWERSYTKECMEKEFTDCEMLRMVMFCEFNRRRTLNFMKKIDARHFRLSIMDLGGQIRTRTIFPCPGLKTKEGSHVFYMRPSRFDPDETPVSLIIDNLIYVMDKMTKKNDQRGITLLANMEGWAMSNFGMDYCRKFMSVLQGKDFPVRADTMLILNPPSWFGKVWVIMKPMLSAKFRERVVMIKERDLYAHMDNNFEEYVPDEVFGGEVDTGNLVRDFVVFQQAMENAMLNQSTYIGKVGLRGFANRQKKIVTASNAGPEWWRRGSIAHQTAASPDDTDEDSEKR